MVQRFDKIITPAIIGILLLSSTILANAEFCLPKNEEIIISSQDFTLEEEQFQGITVNFDSEKYAVIVVSRYYGSWYLGQHNFNITQFLENVSQYYLWYLTDAMHIYEMLQDTYGYDDEHIILLVKELQNLTIPPWNFELPDGFNLSWIDYESNEANIEAVLDSFKPGGDRALSSQDSLFYCFIDHGGNEMVDDWDYDEDWPSPESHVVGGYWTDKNLAYDNYTSTNAVFRPLNIQYQNDWTQDLTLTINPPITIKGFRVNARFYKETKIGNLVIPQILDEMKIEFYNGNEKQAETSLSKWANNKWTYYTYEGEEHSVDKVKIRFHKNSSFGFFVHPAIVNEFDFLTVDGDGSIGQTYFGCNFEDIFDFVRYIFGNDVQKLYDYELADYFGEIEGKITFVLQPCDSGGFIEELSGDDRIICTASRGFQIADEWIGPFIKSLRKLDTDGDGKIDGDLYPEDGEISILEAYRYAADFVELKHPGEYQPLIDDNADSVGHTFYETNYYDYETEGKEGYNAASAFL